jgi:hypothetical protein
VVGYSGSDLPVGGLDQEGANAAEERGWITDDSSLPNPDRRYPVPEIVERVGERVAGMFEESRCGAGDPISECIDWRLQHRGGSSWECCLHDRG